MEFTTAQIKDFAIEEEVFEKGKQLMEENAIVSLDIDDFSNDKIILINATVKDQKHYYEVNMSVDKDDYLVRAHICNCPAHQKNFASCPHCVAVLLKIQTDQELRKVEQAPIKTMQDPIAIRLMNAYEEQLVYTSLAMNLKNAVHLEPVFELRQKRILAVTLKIGNTKKYIIKDISQFLYDVEHNVKKGYGKELEFLHNIHSFDEESIPLIQFLQAHEHDTYYFNSKEALKSAPQARNLCLTKDALDEFFMMYAGKDVMQRRKEKNLINVKFVDQNPDFHVDVKIDEKGMYQISLPDLDYRVLEGRTHTYILKDNILHRCDEEYSKKATPFLKAFLEKKGAFVLSKDLMPGFFNNVLMNIRSMMSFHGVDISEFAPLPLECKVYIDMPKNNVISAKLIYTYGKDEYNAFSCDMLSTSRNFNEEIAVRLVFTKYMTRIDANEGIAYIENSQDAIYEFLQHGFEELNSMCDIYATDKFKKLEIRESVNISMGVRIESDLLEINFDTFDFPIDELQDVLSSYRMHKKYYRMKNGSFVNLEDSALSELSSILDGMHVEEKEISSGVIKVDKYRSLYLDSSMKEVNMIKVDRDTSFKDILRGIRNVQDADYKVPDSLKSILRNYQKVGFRWLKTMSDYGFGGILADDMGIGKTIQIITLLEDEKAHHPESQSLVVCPSSLILNWQSEIEKFSETLTSLIITGSSEDRKTKIANSRDYDVLITSYDYLKRDVEAYEDILFQYQILDEAQYIKNHNTKNATSVKAIQSVHRFALTGTPIENSLAELWSIFDYLMPGYLYTYPYFKKYYEYPIVKENDPVTLKELKRLVEPFILRRVKKDVLKELPPKSEHTMLVEMDEEASKLYLANVAMMKEDLKENMKEHGLPQSRIMVLSMLTRLRQLCCDPRLLYENYEGVGAKIRACMEYIETCRASGKKILLFSQFTSLLSLLEKELIDADIPYYLLKGSTPKIKRQQMVNAFNHDDTCIFLISLKAGGTGLNLTSAEVVIHFDPWWNVSAQNQATDRAYRIGQHNNVQVIKLIAKDTIEEKILHLQDLKKDLSESIISSNEGIITRMSKDELLDLF
ncbi:MULTISPECIES: SNF2 helicase associated domain-containing protein [Bacillota]|uniref:SNF2 helicase associated domain-containing protein n=1 Tax=Amedibacillus hominis TaxID=2897776 RepID=A0ABS9R720_9FIRM|nr:MULTISPECIES: SNF2 helicase associated domain-containing protein [Bacillota]MCH4284968.1 SNF2 helicase associated domain-containing protein [Amedibacillus hominis]RGB55189.1 calcium-binding protein [Absiella sp. AM22-9]RGB62818.1 calcium-binding protein [Absiella sp. AM10-20]RGB63033.1 calcium-binding protein [Absiella sp. AM09-45]RGB72253.1 calcium-binding protein [Absiella sp. AM09-50]